jgi:hypothetical protein
MRFRAPTYKSIEPFSEIIIGRNKWKQQLVNLKFSIRNYFIDKYSRKVIFFN